MHISQSTHQTLLKRGLAWSVKVSLPGPALFFVDSNGAMCSGENEAPAFMFVDFIL
jgi:hypothetical protein